MAAHLKAYTIAADALGRDANFDPQNDPIVRVEAGRLRRALDHYYTDGGCNDPIVIELPRGHYVPVFRANNARFRAITRFHVLRRQFAETHGKISGWCC
jgi:adenylate cyclase